MASADRLSAEETAEIALSVALEIASVNDDDIVGMDDLLPLRTYRHENPHLEHDPADRPGRQFHMSKRDYGAGGLTRFVNAAVTESVPRKRAALDPRNPALREGRTIFPARVFDASQLDRVLISGINNAKLGRKITKGPWAGSPFYHLSLEERKTCPRSCANWAECFVPGTRVLRADLLWVPIETLNIGDRICGFDEFPEERTGRRKSRISVVEALGREVTKSYRISTDRGDVTAAGGHLWLARKDTIGRRTDRANFRWLRTDELGPGNLIQFFHEPWNEDRSYEAGRLRGFVEGEGYCLHSDNGGFAKAGLGWAQKAGTLLDEINAIARSKGYQVSEAVRIGGAAHNEIVHANIMGGWREVLRFLGEMRPSRLFKKAEAMWQDHVFDGRASRPAKITSVDCVGDLETVSIATSTKTLIADGFLAHNCYGNGMPAATRVRYNANLMRALDTQLGELNRRHPDGFAVRLHVLGDFPDLDYVKAWIAWSDKYRALQIEGYTAHPRRSEIGQAIWAMNLRRPKRWQIRNSVPLDAPAEPMQVATLWDGAKAPPPHMDAVVCPQELGKTQTCGTCALCWSPAMSDKRVLFLGHGGRRSPGK